MKYISICSGIEAATTAWHGLGWEPLAFSEIDAFPSAVLAERYPQVPNLGDMSKFREWPEELLADCELLVGGTPCQAFSVAGLRKSLDDERGNLSLIYVQLFHYINEIRRKHGRSPAIALWENVPGVLSTKDNAFGCFISGLLGVDDTIEVEGGKWPKAGFLGSETVRVGYRVLDAQYFAVAQRRRRVFLVAVPCELVASLGERACPSEILSLRESVLGNPPARGAAWEGVARATPISTRTGRSDDRGDGCDNLVAFHPTQDPISSEDGLTHALGTGSSGGCATAAVAIGFKQGANHSGACGGLTEECEPPLTCGQDHNLVAFTKSKRAQSVTDDESWVPGEVSPTMSCFDQGDTRATTVVAFAQNQLGEVRVNPDVMGTVNQNQNASGRNTPMVFANRSTAGPSVAFKPGQGSTSRSLGESEEVSCTLEGAANGNAGHKVAIQSAMQVRRLTPTECEFLQGFPENYTLVTYRKKPAADGPRYRALGNSMAVPCMAWLGWRIHQATGRAK